MSTLNIIFIAVFALAVLWGLLKGATVNTLAVVGFGAGVVLGARVAPLFLRGGLHSTNAPYLGIPVGLVVGGICGAIVERVGRRLEKGLVRLGYANRLAGGVMGGVLGLAIVWVGAAVVIEFDSLRADAWKSTILTRVDDVLALPGPTVDRPLSYTDPFPTIATILPVKGKVNQLITQAPPVQAAVPRVMKVLTNGCWQGPVEDGGQGTGWIAAKGIVVTNAHVIAAGLRIVVQPHGVGRTYKAEPIWFDPKVDIGILRVPGLPGRPLPITIGPKPGTDAAIIGFPLGHFAERPVLLGRESKTILGEMAPDGLPPEFNNNLYGRPITPFEGIGEPGNSGSPLVDRSGHVVGLVFGGGQGQGMAVPTSYVARALAHAGRRVSTGPCPVGMTR